MLAGLVPALERLGHYLPVVVRQWDTPEANVRRTFEETSGLSLTDLPSLSACLLHVAQQTNKTVLVVCDQFEQFFATHPRHSERQPFLQAIGVCVNDHYVPCKFVFVVRADALGHMVEFDSDVPEPLEQRKRFYLPLFSAADATRVLQQLAAKAALDWPGTFVRSVVADLTQDGRVRPVELQLVGAALAVSGISNELDYARAGRAQGLLVDYFNLVLRSVSRSQRELQVMRRVLLALVADPPGRLLLTSTEIAQRMGYAQNVVRQALDRLTEVHLVRCINASPSTTQSTDQTAARYELTHDVLVDLVLILTRDLQDKRRQANRVVNRALEDVAVRPRHTIGLRHWNLVRQHADESVLEQPKVQALLRRSFWWGVCKWFGLLPALVILTLVVVQNTFSYVSLEQDFSDRIVVRRGLPWLGFLPMIGNDVILDTGFTVDDLERKNVSRFKGLCFGSGVTNRAEC